MKNLLRLFISTAILAALALPAFAQTTPTTTTPAASTQCDEKTNTDLYEKWRNARTGDAAQQQVAYETGKEYLQKCTGVADAQYTNAVKKWIDKFEKVKREYDYGQALSGKKFTEAGRLGREILALEPDRVQTMVELAFLGYNASAVDKNDAFNNDAAQFAQMALTAIQAGQQPQCVDAAGKTSPCWSSFKSREDLVGMLNFVTGHFMTKAKRWDEAAAAFHRAAELGLSTKTDASTYANLGAAYAASPEYRGLLQQYENLVKANPDAAGSPEAKAILAKVDPLTDRIIDAYARAIFLANKPEQAASKAIWMKSLTEFYKFRNNNAETGLTELIASVTSKPLPPLKLELPAAPVPTTSTTPATTPATTGTTTPATTTATPPATTNGAKPKP